MSRVRLYGDARAIKWAEQLLSSAPTVYDAVAARPDMRVITHGRAPVYVTSAPFGPVVVKHYMRGGAVARLLHDRYARATAPRPLAEQRISELARERGIATPRVWLAAVYPAGVWYRADAVVEEVAETQNLATVLFAPGTESAVRRASAHKASELVAATAAAAILHRDLNLKNILIREDGARFRAFLIDLDGARVASNALTAERRMRARLVRSFDKLAAVVQGEVAHDRDELRRILAGTA